MALFGLFGGHNPAPATPVASNQPAPVHLGVLDYLDAFFSKGSIGDAIHEKRQAKRNAADMALLASPNPGTVTLPGSGSTAPDGRAYLTGPTAPLAIPALAGRQSAAAYQGATYNAPQGRAFNNPLFALADKSDLTPSQKLAFLMAPKEFGTALASHNEAYTLGAGQERTFGQGGPTDRNGHVLVEAKDGRVVVADESGARSHQVLAPTYKETTDRLQAERPAVLNPGAVLTDIAGRTLAAAPDVKEVDPTKELYANPGYSPGVAGATAAGAPRGVRNNNPLNVRSLPQGAGAWQGQTGVDGGGYSVFDSPENGWRAADLNLQSYGKNHGINTISGIVNRWAPASDNNDPAAYSAFVAKAVGVDPNARIDLADAGVRRKVLDAMAQFENGKPVARPGATPVAAPAPAVGYKLARAAQPKAEDSVRILTVPEAQARGLDPTGVYQMDGKGKITTVDKTDQFEKTTAAFAYRTLEANDRMNDLANNGLFKPKTATDALINTDKNGIVRIVARTNEDRQFVQAAKEWLAPILRKDTGAAVTDAELATYMDIYIPRFEDDVGTIRQKAHARQTAMKALVTQAGRAYGAYGSRSYNVVMPKEPKAPLSREQAVALARSRGLVK